MSEKSHVSLHISEEAMALLTQWARESTTFHSLDEVIEKLIQIEAARRKGQPVEPSSVPIMRVGVQPSASPDRYVNDEAFYEMIARYALMTDEELLQIADPPKADIRDIRAIINEMVNEGFDLDEVLKFPMEDFLEVQMSESSPVSPASSLSAPLPQAAPVRPKPAPSSSSQPATPKDSGWWI